MRTFEDLLNAYARGKREPQTTVSIARHLAAARLAITSSDGSRYTALHFFNEAFAQNSTLKDIYRREYVEALTVGPYVRGDGVTEADLRAAFRSPIVRSRDLVAYAGDFIKDSDAGAALAELRSAPNMTKEAMRPLLRRLSESKVFLATLDTVPISDWDLEADLTTLRRCLLGVANEASLAHDRDAIHVAAALATQCFLNEYVFEERPEEAEQIRILIDTIAHDLSTNRKPSRLALAVSAAYRRLRATLPALSAADLAGAGFERLARLHISDPAEEARLMQAIRTLTPITDPTSGAVRSQYEENPFPTWTAARTAGPRRPARERIAASLASLAPENLSLPEDCSILVAGCGTGQQSVEMASEFRTSRMLAIDLSHRSLAYAKRKAIELRLSSIEFAQADLLELSGFQERFDIITSVGVLHHTRSMSEGWRVLRQLLKPRGVMQIGLYSRIARRRIAEARELIASSRIEPSNEAIRKFRQTLRTLRPDLHQDFSSLADFHTLNQCRDLLFHRHETTHDLPEIGALLNEMKLDLLGFNVDAAAATQYRARFPDDPKMVSIENWHRFELDNPDTFRSMYHLWAVARD